MILYVKRAQQANLQRQKVNQYFLGAEGKEKWRVTANEHGVSYLSDENVLELDSDDDYNYFVMILKTTELYTFKQ